MYLLKKIITIIVGSILLSIGINFFLVPFKLLDGGMIGVGLIISYLTGVKTGLLIISLSIPVFILAWFLNRGYFYNSLHGMLLSSLIIDVLHPFHYSVINSLDLSPLLSSILGGIFIGVGMGIMLRYHTSTGGTDLLAQLLSKVSKVNVGIIIYVFDAIIVCIGGAIVSKETFVFSIITITFAGLFTSLCTWKAEY